jgi:hypothetical protein
VGIATGCGLDGPGIECCVCNGTCWVGGSVCIATGCGLDGPGIECCVCNGTLLKIID